MHDHAIAIYVEPVEQLATFLIITKPLLTLHFKGHSDSFFYQMMNRFLNSTNIENEIISCGSEK